MNMHRTNTTLAAITVITSERPARLSKAFSLGAGGDLLKAPGGQMTRGAAEVRSVASLADFAQILARLTPAQAVTYGTPKAGSGRILSRRAFAEAGRPEGTTTRTNDAFAWPDGAGLMMLDHDPHAGCDPLDREALVQAIRTAAPGVAVSPMIEASKYSSTCRQSP